MALPECSWAENLAPNPLLPPTHLAPNPLLPPTHLALNPLALLRIGRVAQLLTERPEFRGNPFLDDRRRIDDVAHVASIAPDAWLALVTSALRSVHRAWRRGSGIVAPS